MSIILWVYLIKVYVWCLILLDEEYKTKKNYFDNNQRYFRNRQIIKEIRNAVSHGNYSVVYAGGDSKIVFKNIYHGNTTIWFY